jgi:methylamine--corrinoid protein Co-methyltransferase
MAAMASACGASQLLGVRSATGVVPNHCSGLEARFNAEVGHAAAGLNREKTNEIVEKAVSEYENDLSKEPFGKQFAEVYDPMRIRPRDEWMSVYDRVKEQVAKWGLDFP